MDRSTITKLNAIYGWDIPYNNNQSAPGFPVYPPSRAPVTGSTTFENPIPDAMDISDIGWTITFT